MNQNPSDLLREWQLRTKRMQWLHFAAENLFHRRHVQIGVPSVIMSIVAGSSVAFSTGGSDGLAGVIAIIIAATSVGAAILTGLQTFLKLEERATQHGQAARLYGAIRLRCSRALTLEGDSIRTQVESLSKELEEVESRVPAVPASIWRNRDEICKDESFDKVAEQSASKPA